MAKTTKKDEQPKTLTRAEKQAAAKEIVRELLRKEAYTEKELIAEASNLFTERFAGEEADNQNGVRGRIGSVLDVMKKESEVAFDGGKYALNGENKEVAEAVAEVKTEEKPKKRTRAKKVTEEKTEEIAEPKAEEKPAKAKRAAKKKTAEPLPTAPLQPIAPTAPISPETAPEPIPEKEEKAEETPAPVKPKRTRAKKTATKTEVKAEEKAEIETETKEAAPAEEKPEVKAEEKAEEPKKEEPKHALVDMSFLFGDIKPAKKEPRAAEKTEKTEKTEKAERDEKPVERTEKKEPPQAEEKKEVKTEARPAPAKPVPAPAQKQETKKTEQQKPQQRNARGSRGGKNAKALTPDEKLQEAFLARLHKLGGEYFEYYSIYLLERYSRMNGRRLETLKVTGGDHDGGIDGEIELTDRLGFRETIYIQAKNWDPDKGDEKLWVVGETLLQQFIGACVCRQQKDGKQHCRGMFITTSRFTPEAKRLLDDMSDKFVGYDGAELYETAKECGFGIVKKNGEYALDENLLSSAKAFFNMY